MKITLHALSARHLSASHTAARLQAANAITGITLDVAPGEQLAIIGPSGAGKTTLLHTIASSLVPSEGNISLNGVNPWEIPRSQLQALRGQLFLAPQTPPLPPRQRVVTALHAGQLPAMNLWQSLRSLFYPINIAAAHAALEKFDIADKLFDRVDRLSGGERQRVGLARALMSPASLWLIDEPLSALDPKRATQALDSLTGEAASRGLTLVMTLHQVKEALDRFPRIVGLREGKMLFDLPSAQVTPAKLAQLYEHYESELEPGSTAAADGQDEGQSTKAAPAVMHCR